MERFEDNGGKYTRNGVAKDRGLKSQCKKKLCIVSIDKSLLFDLMFEISHANDCFQVDVRKEERLNVYLGQCTFTNDASVGDAWAKYAAHPSLWAFIHDDEFCEFFKRRIREY